MKNSLRPYFVTQITHFQTLWPHKRPLIISTLTLVTNIFTNVSPICFAAVLSQSALIIFTSSIGHGTNAYIRSTREHHICTFRNRRSASFFLCLVDVFFSTVYFFFHFSGMCSSAVSRIQHFFDELWIGGSIHIPILNFTFYAQFSSLSM